MEGRKEKTEGGGREGEMSGLEGGRKGGGREGGNQSNCDTN